MKPFSQITEPDERQQLVCLSLDNLHSELAAIALNERVPDDVQEIFDTAKNLSLYSWFVSDFHAVAEFVGLSSLEAALRARAREQSAALAKKRLREIVHYAVKAGWIDEERIEGRHEMARTRVKFRKAIEAIEEMKIAGKYEVTMPDPTEIEIGEEASGMKVVEQICNAAVDLRNAMAHGELGLDMGSHHRLRITAGLINQLFS